MINGDIDWELAYRDYKEHGVCVIDNFLAATVIQSLRKFALDVQYRDAFYEG